MNAVETGDSKKEEVIEEAKERLTSILKEYQQKEKKIGEELGKALNEYYEKKYVLGKCPKCDGHLKVVRSKKTKKRFIGCSNYPECTESYPLPQKGGIRSANKNCPECNLPMVATTGRNIRVFCPNLSCVSNKRL